MSNPFDRPIIITGCPRSGASMTAGVLGICGAFYGYDRRGTYENPLIKAYVTLPYFKLLGADVHGQKPLPAPDVFPPFPELKFIIGGTLNHQRYNPDHRWMYKSNSCILCWPMWHREFPEAEWIIVRRNTPAIVNSCMHTGYMRAYNTPGEWTEWVGEYERRFDGLKQSGARVTEVWPTDFLTGRMEGLKALVAGLELDYREDQVREFLTVKPWRNSYVV